MDYLFTNYNEDDENELEYDYSNEEQRDMKINMEELYESKQRTDLIKLNMFNKLLKRVHTKIKTTSRQKKNNTICFFVMPEIMIGYPRYDVGECVVYIMDQLNQNGFNTKYIHPNLIIICWEHWVPEYVRKQYKMKTGIEIDERGNEVRKEEENDIFSIIKNPINFLGNNNNNNNKAQPKKTKKVAFKDINQFTTNNKYF